MEYVSKQGHEIWGLLMMAHMIKPDQLAREAKKWRVMVLHALYYGFGRAPLQMVKTSAMKYFQ